jgi:NADH-quinone oxidoreductase subunit I
MKKKTKIGKILRNLLLLEILQGLALTLKHLFVGKITIQYPREKRKLPVGYRGLLSLLRYDNGVEKCVGCALCEAVCPSRCITVKSDEIEGEPLKRYAREFTIDITRCVFCGWCVDACPVNALAMTPEYEYAVYDKRELIFDKQKLLSMGDKAFPEREKPIEAQHVNVAAFNTARKELPPHGEENR